MNNKIGGIIGLRKGVAAAIEAVKLYDLECLDIFLPVHRNPTPTDELKQLVASVCIPTTFHFRNSTILTDPQYYALILEQTLEYIRVAQELDVRIITIHPPSTRRKNKRGRVMFKFEDEQWFYDSLDYGVTNSYEESKEVFLQYLCHIAPYAASSGVCIAIENTDRNERDFGERIEGVTIGADLAACIGNPSIKLCLDLCKAYTTNEHLSAIDLYWDSIVQVQVSDFSHFEQSGHVALGGGDIPLEEVFQKFFYKKYSGNYIVEVSETQLRESISFLRNMCHSIVRSHNPTTR